MKSFLIGFTVTFIGIVGFMALIWTIFSGANWALQHGGPAGEFVYAAFIFSIFIGVHRCSTT